jgi:hypothetical protein
MKRKGRKKEKERKTWICEGYALLPLLGKFRRVHRKLQV